MLTSPGVVWLLLSFAGLLWCSVLYTHESSHQVLLRKATCSLLMISLSLRILIMCGVDQANRQALDIRTCSRSCPDVPVCVLYACHNHHSSHHWSPCNSFHHTLLIWSVLTVILPHTRASHTLVCFRVSVTSSELHLPTKKHAHALIGCLFMSCKHTQAHTHA